MMTTMLLGELFNVGPSHNLVSAQCTDQAEYPIIVSDGEADLIEIIAMDANADVIVVFLRAVSDEFWSEPRTAHFLVMAFDTQTGAYRWTAEPHAGQG